MTRTIILTVAGIILGGVALALAKDRLKIKIALKESFGAVMFVFAFGVTVILFNVFVLKYRQQWIADIMMCVTILLLFTVLFFFRDPDRKINGTEGGIISPADGVIDLIEENTKVSGIAGRAKRISIFLSLFNVHVQRMPVDGKIERLIPVEGKVLPAFLGESSEKNRHNIYIIQGTIPVVLRQISGIVAQRPVAWVKEGDNLKTGDRLGLIKFGSRVDIFMPADAELKAVKGQRVYGGETLLGIIAKDAVAAKTKKKA
ncbi:MAG: phosphatidylserine decarboxylase [Candidatus Firestonebacteria bacterium]